MLLTQHGKERALAPILLDGLGVLTEVVSGFDTDLLGTFTRDVERAGTQLEAARRKAHIAIERSGGSFGLGSEGSFGPGPFGIGCWNVELLLLADAVRGIEVVGVAHGPGLHVHDVAESEEQLGEIAERAGFPEHGLVVHPDGPDDPRVRKGITTWEMLRAAFADARRHVRPADFQGLACARLSRGSRAQHAARPRRLRARMCTPASAALCARSGSAPVRRRSIQATARTAIPDVSPPIGGRAFAALCESSLG